MKYSKAPSQRQLRVAEEVRHILAEVFKRGTSGSELLDSSSIMVTEVRLSPDLRNGTAFVMSLGGLKLDEILEELKAHRHYFSHEVAQRLTTKMTPRLNFKPDESFNEVQKLENLFKDPKVVRDLQRAEDE